MKEYSWENKKPIMASNIIYAVTSELDYEMNRLIILEENYKYIILEGSHCSCYDFDEVIWNATEFKDLKEMKKYLNAENWGLRRKAFEFMNYYSSEFRNHSLEISY